MEYLRSKVNERRSENRTIEANNELTSEEELNRMTNEVEYNVEPCRSSTSNERSPVPVVTTDLSAALD